MSENLLFWELQEEKVEQVEKYCDGCKKKVEFHDSLVRRHNANGKNIYQYAIYKCSKGHTWNKILKKYNSTKANELNDIDISYATSYLKDSNYKREEETNTSISKISINEFKNNNFKDINIMITGNMETRLDKLLAEHILDLSRNEIQSKVKTGIVLVNGEMVKPKYKIRDKDQITIIIN